MSNRVLLCEGLKMYPNNGNLNVAAELQAGAQLIDFPDASFPLNFWQSPSAYDGFLFIEPPQLTHIQQRNIGNCYLLAALQSMILRKSDALLNMLCFDVARNRVVVKLYWQNIPYLIYLEKTVIQQFFNSNASWVHMIEKAYAVLRLRFFPLTGDFKDILRGGHSDEAFHILCGPQAQKIAILPERFISPERMGVSISTVEQYSDLYYVLRPIGTGTVEARRQRALTNIFSDDMQRTDFENLANQNDANRIILNFFGNQTHQYKHVLRRETLVQQIEQYYQHLLPTTRQTLIRYVIEHCPQKRGSTVYVDNQIMHYDRIFQALANGRMVCVATDYHNSGYWHRHNSDSLWHIFHSKSTKGLVPNHVYTVMNAYQRDGRYYLLLRNPWYFSYRRGYVEKPNRLGALPVITRLFAPAVIDPQSEERVATTYLQDIDWNPLQDVPPAPVIEELRQFRRIQNVFELKLSDLTKRFSHIYIS